MSASVGAFTVQYRVTGAVDGRSRSDVGRFQTHRAEVYAEPVATME
ncbi:MAG: hypothetical protein R2851_20900 [Caldilineaceae bacterium]